MASLREDTKSQYQTYIKNGVNFVVPAVVNFSILQFQKLLDSFQTFFIQGYLTQPLTLHAVPYLPCARRKPLPYPLESILWLNGS